MVAQWLEHRAGDQGVLGSNPAGFGTLAIPFYLVYMPALPGEVKYPTHGVNV